MKVFLIDCLNPISSLYSLNPQRLILRISLQNFEKVKILNSRIWKIDVQLLHLACNKWMLTRTLVFGTLFLIVLWNFVKKECMIISRAGWCSIVKLIKSLHTSSDYWNGGPPVRACRTASRSAKDLAGLIRHMTFRRCNSTDLIPHPTGLSLSRRLVKN